MDNETNNEIDNKKSDDSITLLNGEINSLKSVLAVTIDNVIDRGIKIDKIDDKTNELNENATKFNEYSKNIKHKLCLRYYKSIICIIVTLIIIALLIYWIYDINTSYL